uniref:pyridoxine 5'-phosphate synthase n=1 Tax=Candidatus Cryptobacteroides bacterium TaxID=3085639 RepID=UPI004027DF7D
TPSNIFNFFRILKCQTTGHDLNLENLEYFIRTIPWTDEVSIGHAIICDALYMGLEKTIQAYLSKIKIF